MKTIKTFGNLAEAGFACSLLEAAGMRAALLDEQAFLLTPGMLTDGIRLQVEEADMERALTLLATGPTARLPVDSATTEALLVEQASKSSTLGPVFIGAALAGIIGFLIGIKWAEWQPFADRVQKSEYDYNHDGRTDHTFTYRGNRPVSSTADRNGDGNVDEWQTFDLEGVASETSSDNDFDGTPDCWFTYRHGNVVTARCDLDSDGRVDWTATYENGLVVSAELAPNESPRVSRKERYERGLLREEWVDENQDGVFDHRFEYDPFGHRSERLPLR